MSTFTIDLNPQFKEALQILEETQNHLMITGKAGTGKSTLLSYFRTVTKKKYAVVAPTGIAAVNIDGETIHSFFKFKPNIDPVEAARLAKFTKNKELYRTLEILIIDEISMVRADLLDAIDTFLREVRKDQTPFGGVQMILIGDMFQLPPVLGNDERELFQNVYESPYFFDSVAFAQIAGNISFIELEKIYRQNEAEFIEILNAIRNATFTEEQLNYINAKCYNKPITTKNMIYLASTNAAAEDLNKRYMAQLPAISKKIKGSTSGAFEGRTLPTDEELELKVGARVMFLNNDGEKRWINGTLGAVKGFSSSFGDNIIEVQIDNGGVVEVEPFTWTAYRSVYDQDKDTIKREESGSFTQVPLRLAWAITIHKSQGKTFDNVMIDLGKNAFASGQTYVALSRCRNLEGIILKRPLKPSDIIIDERITDFYKRVSR